VGLFSKSEHTLVRTLPRDASLASQEAKYVCVYICMSLLQGSFAKETYDFKESTDRSHVIHMLVLKSCSASEEAKYIGVCICTSLLQGSFAKETYDFSSQELLCLSRGDVQ